MEENRLKMAATSENEGERKYYNIEAIEEDFGVENIEGYKKELQSSLLLVAACAALDNTKRRVMRG